MTHPSSTDEHQKGTFGGGTAYLSVLLVCIFTDSQPR